VKKSNAIAVFESLASPVRLDLFRHLVKIGPAGCVAGEIATALDLPATNISFHLKALTQANLISVEQEGRFLRYRANIPLIQKVIGYLTEECCSGAPEKCFPADCCSANDSKKSPKASHKS